MAGVWEQVRSRETRAGLGKLRAGTPVLMLSERTPSAFG